MWWWPRYPACAKAAWWRSTPSTWTAFPQFDYDRLLWGERQIRSVANMTRADARDFLQLAHEIGLRPKVTVFPLEQANEALLALKSDAIDGAAVLVP